MPESDRFRALLSHLAVVAPGASPTVAVNGWNAERVAGGANNVLYRVWQSQAPGGTVSAGGAGAAGGPGAAGAAPAYAVKFTIADGRDRAGREYAALAVLREAALELAPEPVLLDRERYGLPVVVQTWLEGTVSDAPPVLEDEWRRLVDHYAVLHTVTPERVAAPLPEAVLTMSGAADGRRRIEEQVARVPEAHRPDELLDAIGLLENSPLAGVSWGAPARALCRCDANTTNFIRRPDHPSGWASVDWENSGWGDPAFEVAELSAHAAYLDVPPERWDWVADAYCAARTGLPDPTLAMRIRVYRAMLLVWWVARLARALYEVPRGLDQRLAPRPSTWREDCARKLREYHRRARLILA